jgi:hypothetical protein
MSGTRRNKISNNRRCKAEESERTRREQEGEGRKGPHGSRMIGTQNGEDRVGGTARDSGAASQTLGWNRAGSSLACTLCLAVITMRTTLNTHSGRDNQD